MGLFDNIFKTGGATSALFADNSKFKAHEAPTVPAPKLGAASEPAAAAAAAAKPSSAAGKRKREGEQASDKGAKKAGRPRAAEARQQAEKVAGAAASARGLNSDDEEAPAAAPAAPVPTTKSKGDKKAKKTKKEPASEPATTAAAAPAAAADKPSAKKKKEKKEKPLKSKKKEVPEAENGAESDSEGEDGGNDAVERLARTIFVGNVPASAKKKALATLFSSFGPVESVRWRSVPLKPEAAVKLPRRAAVTSGAVDAARAPAVAFIVFKEASAAEAALSFNMKEWEGHHLRVDRAGGVSEGSRTLLFGPGAKAAPLALPKREEDGVPVRYDPARSVFIGNLHVEAQDEELIRFFLEGMGGGSEGELEAVRVIRDPQTQLGKGIAYALFRSGEGRRAALGLDGRALRGRALRVQRVKTGGGASVGASGLKNKKKVASWQGATATKSGRVKGPGGKAPAAAGGGGAKKGGPVPGRKREGKRPAVLARKQKMLGLPVTAGVKKKKPSGGDKKKMSPAK